MDTTTKQHFINEKEFKAKKQKNRSPNNNKLSSIESHQNNPNATATVIKANVPRRGIGRVIGKKGKLINYLKEQNKVKITTTIQKTDYQNITITGN